MPSIARQKVFQEFHKRVDVKPFAPEFIDSLIAVMRDPNACLSERVFAWARWRAWGNSSEYAVSDWDPGTARFLDQMDCAVDLAWFEEGKLVQWVEGAPEEFRKKARSGLEPLRLLKDKSKISKAFTKNKIRGTVHFEGRRIYPVISPPPVSPAKLTVGATLEGDPAFFEWWKVDDPSNYRNFELARNAYKSARKLARTAYRRYKEQSRFEPANLITEKNLLNNPKPSSDVQICAGPGEASTDYVRSDGRVSDISLKAEIRAWLITSFKLPIAPSDDVLSMIASHCRDEGGLEQLKLACAGLKPRKWIVFVTVAKRCSEHRNAYETAGVAVGSAGQIRTPKWAEGL